MTDDRGLVWEAKEIAEANEREAAGRNETGGVSRRAFLKAAGFTLGAAAVSCGRGPVEYAIPLLVQPEEMTPGRATLYATMCGGCTARCGVVARTREGRPVKLEGNPSHPMSRGGLCAVGQASLLGLYDALRLGDPWKDGRTTSWDVLDGEVRAALEAIRVRGGRVRVLSETILSPTTRALVERLLTTFSGARLVEYDPLSTSARLDAHESLFGVRVLPRLDLAAARVLVGFDADLLGSWISPVEYAAGWAERRDPERFSHHTHFESRMTVTGAKADRRVRISPFEMPHALARLAGLLAARAGRTLPIPSVVPLDAALEAALAETAERLWSSRGESLVVCGTNDLASQMLAAAANELLGNYGKTLDLLSPSHQKRGDDRAVGALLEEMEAGSIDALLILGENPAADLPSRARFGRALARMTADPSRVTVAFSAMNDETARAVRYVAPSPHFLASWDDAEAVEGVVTIGQPLVASWDRARPVRETLAAWMGERMEDREIVRRYWAQAIFPRRSDPAFTFETFWNRSVHEGWVRVAPRAARPGAFRGAALARIAFPPPAPASQLALVLHSSVGLREGQGASNPWLQELPDPVTKVTWGNCASFAPETAARLGVAEGDLVEIATDDGRITLPAHHQPGQDARTVAVALGHGRVATERFASTGPRWIFGGSSVGGDGRVGVDAGDLVSLRGGTATTIVPAAIRKAGGARPLATTQDHHLLNVPEGLGQPGAKLRPIIRATTLAAVAAGQAAEATGHPEAGLWEPDHRFKGYHWGMAIDLTKCNGCSACVVACQAENNVPVVGRDEVLRNREMHWLRIDRYYSDESGDVDVAFQPMTCHHCDHAPCETVCPVLATVHSSEGLNQQVYNRCVGTRYCANNCPYKVRRFNWFDYARDDKVANLALNPDITVRSRGVMEKCSMCIQRIQEARAKARAEGRPIGDGEIQPACAQSCPSQAIVFGDRNDPKSRVTRAGLDDRHYHVLEELNVKPALGYLAIVRNRASS